MIDDVEPSLNEAAHIVETVTSGSSWIEDFCEAICGLFLIAMIVMIGSEAIATFRRFLPAFSMARDRIMRPRLAPLRSHLPKRPRLERGLGWTSGAPETLIYLLTCASRREAERHAADPHPGFYTEVAHYLEAIQPAGSDDADTVVGHCAR